MTPAKHWDLFCENSNALGAEVRSPFFTPVARAAAAASGTGERRVASRAGKVRPVILLWALGVPIPILVLILLIRGCVG